jgi:hypothetical protein
MSVVAMSCYDSATLDLDCHSFTDFSPFLQRESCSSCGRSGRRRAEVGFAIFPHVFGWSAAKFFFLILFLVIRVVSTFVADPTILAEFLTTIWATRVFVILVLVLLTCSSDEL